MWFVYKYLLRVFRVLGIVLIIEDRMGYRIDMVGVYRIRVYIFVRV